MLRLVTMNTISKPIERDQNANGESMKREEQMSPPAYKGFYFTTDHALWIRGAVGGCDKWRLRSN